MGLPGGGISVGYFEANAENLKDDEITPFSWEGWFNSFNLGIGPLGTGYFWSEEDNSQQIRQKDPVWEGSSYSPIFGWSANWAFTNYWSIGGVKEIDPNLVGKEKEGTVEVDMSEYTSQPYEEKDDK